MLKIRLFFNVKSFLPKIELPPFLIDISNINTYTLTCKIFTLLGPGELLPSLGVRRLLSVNFSHFKLLLRNHWADWNQT